MRRVLLVALVAATTAGARQADTVLSAVIARATPRALTPPPTPPPPPAVGDSRLTNVSVRSLAGSDSGTLIVGFAVAGSGTKHVLLRGIGPGLKPYGVASPVADPKLVVHGANGGIVAENNDWGGGDALAASFAAVGAFPLPPDSRDAAVLVPASAGLYSAELQPVGGTGVALVEAYDQDALTAPARLVNVSARSTSRTGEGVLTIGFAITGSGPRTVVIRAVGPALRAYGLTDSLASPVLDLFSASKNNLGHNDSWLFDAGWADAFTSVGAFSLVAGSNDAALVVSLRPGTYTAQASGASGTSGVALIEVYDAPNVPASSCVLLPVENATPDTFVGTSRPPGSIVKYPVATSQTAPAYPLYFRYAGVTGDATIDFIVGPAGVVTDAIVLRATDSRFGDAALAAVRLWRFTPGTINGIAASFHLQVPVMFVLND